MVSTNAAVAVEKRSGFMPSAEKRIYAIEDIESLPEGERAELIDGKIYYMATPKYIHQKLLVELSTIINNYLKSKGWLKREIGRGIGRGIGNAIGQAVGQAVKPAADRVAEKTITPRVNQAADTINQAAGQQPMQGQQATNNLTGALFNFKSAMMNVANEAAKNMKVCPSCGEPTTADKSFCPSCGAQLPEQTAAESAVCQSCGHQNDLGTKFCAGCGAKMPELGPKEEAEAPICSGCGEELPEGMKFCPNCGTPVPQKEEAVQAAPACPGCGAEVAPGAKFCMGCGTKLQ